MSSEKEERSETEAGGGGNSGSPGSAVVGTAENMLNQLEENLAAQKDFDEAELLQSREPGPLGPEGREVEEVLNIMSQSIYREGEGQLLLKLSDRSSLLSVVSHSLSAYITTLDPVPLQRLSGRIASEVGLWVCHLFKFSKGSAFCHDDMREGLVKITRLTLFKHYPKMIENGFEALYSRPPVIYLTSNTYHEVANYICLQLGLPASTVKLLKTGEGAQQLDLEKIISEDKASGRLPILCIANVHSSIFQAQNVKQFEAVCRKNNVWLHLEGHALAGLVLTRKKEEHPTGDSMVLTLGSWIGIPAVPFVTLYKSGNTSEEASMSGLSTLNPAVRLNCLPLWCVLRSLGENQLQERIANIFQMLEVFSQKLGQMKCLRILSQRDNKGKFTTIEELSKDDFDVSKVYRTVSPALAFQYVSDSPPDTDSRVPPYYDNLNSWLGQIMQRDCPQIPLDIVDVETTGYVLRLCPFESLAISGNSLCDEDLQAFIQGIEAQTSILNATVCQREKFIELIGKEEQLEHIELLHWAGLGGVRYLPEQFKDTSKLSEEDKNTLNHRNIELVSRLRNMDSAFSLGESEDGKISIRFGMVSMDTDVGELLKLVVKTGLELDDKIKELENMTELVRKGIEQAQGELRKESEEVLWQEGILRHVPLVGSFYNWLSPLEKPNIKGRTLKLEEGKLATTDEIYTLKKDQKESKVEENNHNDEPLAVVEEGAKNEAEAETVEAK